MEAGEKAKRQTKAKKLTGAVADAARYPAHKTKGPHYVWDSVRSGFALVVQPSGTKTFTYRYTSPVTGQRRYFPCGEWPTTSVQRARELAEEAHGKVKEGRDPQEERRSVREAPTVAEFADRFLGEHVAYKKPSTRRNTEHLLREHVIPALGNKKLRDVSKADVVRLTHKLRATPYQANRALAALSKMLNTADAWGLHLGENWRNPCHGVEKYREEKRRRYLSGEELSRLGQVLAEEEASNPFAVAAIKLLLFTGCRRDEVLGLRWEWVDFERRMLMLPDSKTGAKVVALNSFAMALLGELRQQVSGPYVIPGQERNQRRHDLNRPWRRIREKAGIPDVRLHDLRHTFGSTGAGAGLGLPLIGGLLGHTQPSTTHRYAHLAADPLHAAAETIGSEIAAKLNGKTGEVVPFRRSA